MSAAGAGAAAGRALGRAGRRLAPYAPWAAFAAVSAPHVWALGGPPAGVAYLGMVAAGFAFLRADRRMRAGDRDLAAARAALAVADDARRAAEDQVPRYCVTYETAEAMRAAVGVLTAAGYRLETTSDGRPVDAALAAGMLDDAARTGRLA